MNFFKNEQKTIIFTGGSRGIGRKLILKLKESYNIINISRKKSNISKVKDLKCNISNINEVKKTFKKIKKANFLINCAGITLSSKNIIKNFDDTININLKGTFYCCHEALRLLKKNKNSSIINFASINGYQAFPQNPGYVSSKGGINALTRSLALDYGKYNIKVNSISPGYINEGMAKKSYKNKKLRNERLSRMIIKRFGESNDLIGVIDLLLGEKSNYITGQDFVVDGGWVIKGL